MNEDILLQVRKPGRYIGNEWNVSRKDFDKAGIKFALCFPDLYEVGMSNLGMRILYGILNSVADVACERFFSPDIDLENRLRSNHLEIFSLESKRRLREFDIVGFSLGCELDYTNVLNILELGDIPLKSCLRDHSHPLILGGGPCTLNPEPVHDFFDVFLIGEAEDSILEFIKVYRQYQQRYRHNKIGKQDLLSIFSQLEGVYVPSLYEVIYSGTGEILEFKPKIKGAPPKIKKRFVKDLNSSFFPIEWLVPNIQIIHDRITLEVMRGCPNKCSFCQARVFYYPLRMRDKKNIQEKAGQIYRHSGYEEISLCGLSVSEYSNIEELLSSLINSFKDKAVSVSLPSIKAKPQVGNLSSLIASVKKTGLTFAPEAGTQRLRKIMGKDFNEQEFFKSLEQAYSAGYRHVKLYFMIGLPHELQSDLDAIIDFSTRVSELKRNIDSTPASGVRANRIPAQLNLSINTLIPKPHTPIQWFGMEDLDSIKQKQDYLKSKTKNNKRLKLNFHQRYMSFLEGVLSRGDRRLSEVIFLSFKKGARFDAWANYFSFEKWLDAFRESNIDPHYYLKPKPTDAVLPWDFIDVAISKHTLIEEFNNLIAI
jgi:radical SAM family uncharacterized protein